MADPTTGQVTDPATFFDTVEPNPNGDRWDRYFKAWPAIAVAVVLTAVIGGAILRERSSGVAAELAVGDCFVEPVGAETVKDVQHQPCAGAHDAEVFALLTMSGSTYPTTENFEAFFTNRCLGSVFQDYTGRSFDDLTELDAGYFYPTTEGWDRGDRRMTCYLAATTKGAKLDHSWRSPSP